MFLFINIDFILFVAYNKDVDGRLKFRLKEKGRTAILPFSLSKTMNGCCNYLNGDINNNKEKSYFIKNQITNTQGKIKTLFEDYINGNITSTEYKQFLNQTKKEIENLQIELSKYEALINVTYSEELYKTVVNDFLAKKNVIKDPVILAKVIFR